MLGYVGFKILDGEIFQSTIIHLNLDIALLFGNGNPRILLILLWHLRIESIILKLLDLLRLIQVLLWNLLDI